LEEALPPKRKDLLGETKMTVDDKTSLGWCRMVESGWCRPEVAHTRPNLSAEEKECRESQFYQRLPSLSTSEPVVSILERSRNFATRFLLLNSTEEKAADDAASSVIRKFTYVNISTKVITSNN
jgi:hypothetical protein